MTNTVLISNNDTRVYIVCEKALMPHSICISGIPEKDGTAIQVAKEALQYEKSVVLSFDTQEDGTVSATVDAYFAVSNAAVEALIDRGMPEKDIIAGVPHLSNDAEGTKPVCYTDKTGTLKYVSSQLLEDQPDAVQEVCKTAQNINNTQAPTGSWCFDFRDKEASSLLPLTTATLARQTGTNLWLLPIFEHLGHSVDIPEQTLPGSLTRSLGGTTLEASFSHVYLDLDDTLLIHGSINPHVHKLLLHCNDAGCPVSLITRHFREPGVTLAEHNIPAGLFEEIHWITDGTPKSHFMQETENALFVDDAYQERIAVLRDTGIPSYPPDIAEIITPLFTQC